jgi:hypothetical protein
MLIDRVVLLKTETEMQVLRYQFVVFVCYLPQLVSILGSIFPCMHVCVFRNLVVHGCVAGIS